MFLADGAAVYVSQGVSCSLQDLSLITVSGAAGFGCVSSPWHSFTAKARPVTDIDVSRAQGGLDATIEMLETKRNRMRFLENKIQEKKVIGLVS